MPELKSPTERVLWAAIQEQSELILELCAWDEDKWMVSRAIDWRDGLIRKLNGCADTGASGR
jgi:hypothetical protein